MPGRTYCPAVDFKVIHFYDKRCPHPEGEVGREIILLYALGEDGIVREYVNGAWVPLPIPLEAST
jgi:hypothetical protein